MELEFLPLTSPDTEFLLANMRRNERCSDQAERVLRYSYDARVATVDGEPAAAWGVYGELLDPSYPWLVTTPLVEKYPMRFLRESRKQIALLRDRHGPLSGLVECGYGMSSRWLNWLGAEFGGTSRLPNGTKVRAFTWQ